MANQQLIPVVAVFAERKQAEGAVDELWRGGVPKDRIGFAAPGETLRRATTATETQENTAATGAARGAVAGGALGALGGAVAATLVPGLGVVFGGSLLLGLVTGAAAGVALGGFAGPFVALGLAEKTAQRYEAEVRAGRTLVLVQTDNPETGVLATLQGHGPDYVEIAGQRVVTPPA